MAIKPQKRSLGRGLSTLLPENPIDEQKDGYAIVLISSIERNPFQPRQNLQLNTILDLSESIKEKGLIQPLTVVRHKTDTDKYLLVAGERRLEAAKLAQFKEVPVIIMQMNDQEIAEVALIENIHRKDLNPIEEGYAFLRLFKEFNLSFDEISRKVSKSKAYIENKIRITKLPQIVQNAISVGEITENHGRALLSLTDEEAIIAALKIVIRNNLTAQRTEELVRQIKSESQTEKKSLRHNPTLEWEQKFNYIKANLTEEMGFSVRLKRNKKDGGALVINFINDDELVSIYRKIAGKADGSE